MITKPKGTYDIYGDEGKKWQYVSRVVDEVMERYNYGFIRTPIFESTELFHRGVGDTTDIVSKETYDFMDRGERNMTLRPEGTAGVVRSFIENKMYGDAIQPVKLYYNGTMYRYERPQSGRDRELTQFGVEVLGSSDPAMDAEVISVAVNIFKMLGLKGVKVKINSLGDTESRNAYRDALVEYFKPHMSELCPDCNERLNKNPLRILDCKFDANLDVIKNAPTILDYLNEDSKNRFEDVQNYLEVLDIDYEVDPKIVRGLDYYCHTVFEIEATVEGFGSNNVLAGGGRYDTLVSNLGGPETPGIGFACGLGRLINALNLENIELPINKGLDAFVLYVNNAEKEYAMALTQDLRINGFRVETDTMGRSLKGQFKQADRFNPKFLIILNSDDLVAGEIQVKDNLTKETIMVKEAEIDDYLDMNCR
jgi:histidyl-tRNA synthetase